MKTSVGAMENEEISSVQNNLDKGNKLKVLEDAVDNLYSYNDCYFEHHDLKEAAQKQNRIKERLDKTLQQFEENKAEVITVPQYRARYWYQLGRAHNILPGYSGRAEEALAKAVKLDPKLIPAWNQLGECYWKKDDFQEAKNCFQGALSQNENKVSLRNLSMLARQEVASNHEERAKNVEKGVSLARQAVQMDTNDGVSWSVLGNAYFVAFFTILQNPHTLRQAMSAYAQAEKDPSARNSPDLHYNKAVAYKYDERYEEALLGFTRAKELDPTWEAPGIKQQQLVRFLDNVVEMVRTKGKLKAKRLNSLLQGIDNRQLGPYSGGLYKSSKGGSCKLEHVNLSDLISGINSEKVVLGKVICSVHDEDCVPFTFCMIDKQQTVLPVMLYNLAEGKGVIIGDSVAIPEPFITSFQFTFDSKVYKFNSIRVDSPIVLVVNGKKLGRDQQASVQLSTFKMP